MVLNKQERKRLPATLARSPEKAQATYMHTLEAAEEVHGDGEAAHRIAFGSLKHSFEKAVVEAYSRLSVEEPPRVAEDLHSIAAANLTRWSSGRT